MINCKLKSAKILIVEDNLGDIRLIEEAFKDSKLLNETEILTDGETAMNYFESIADEPSTYPDLTILDLNLPKKSGLEILNFIKTHEKLKIIPVVILTTSQADEDIMKSYDLYANCYITKPVDFDQFIKIVQNVNDFWFSIVKLPK